MLFTISDTEEFNDYLLKEKNGVGLFRVVEAKSTSHFSTPAHHHHGKTHVSSLHLLMATCIHAHAYTNPTRTQATCFHPSACLVTKHFLNHFAPSFCNILQQIKHPLLGMFSICFMLILIKEPETEQTVPSRWPYKCEISKLFYLPQTLLVNFFKLIQACESADSKEKAKQSLRPNICFCYSSWSQRLVVSTFAPPSSTLSPRPISGTPLAQPQSHKYLY